MIDRQSQDWKEVEKWARGEIEAARDNLELYVDHDAAQFYRGRIASLRDLLALVQPPGRP